MFRALRGTKYVRMQMHDNVPVNGWMYYVMATQYWRLAGNAPNAIACARMALHYVDE